MVRVFDWTITPFWAQAVIVDKYKFNKSTSDQKLYGAFATEVFRGAFLAVPKGQIEAAQSLALSEMQVFTRVVLPPSLKRVWPALVRSECR